MSRKKKKKRRLTFGIVGTLKEETRHFMLSIIFFVGALFFALASFNKAGIAGVSLYHWLEFAFGVGYFLIPLCFAMLGVLFLRNTRPNIALPALVGAALFLTSGLGIINLAEENAGGIIGKAIARPLIPLFGFWFSIIFLLALFIISISIIFDWKPTRPTWNFPFSLKRKGNEESDENTSMKEEDDEENEYEDEEEEEDEEIEEDDEDDEAGDADTGILKKLRTRSKKTTKEDSELPDGDDLTHMYATQAYDAPPLSLLSGDKGKPGVGDIKANANTIKRTLKNFGILVEMDEISIGPSITRYALKPAEGVKLSRIVGLQNDLSLALAAHPIRIEAPIPGKSLVGIEIPNSTKTTVGLGALLSSSEYQKSTRPLMLSLGRGISGKSYFANLAKMPHLLIAGTTGSGKSVAIHTLVTSLIYRNHPANLRFIMIDPKRVELTAYNKIPHLQTPVITDPKKAIKALKWAAKEMNRRYDILETEKVRDIESYHKTILAPALEGRSLDDDAADLPESMPYIVIIIDELADIMTSYPREMEAEIVRLAQMSRAVGIHLILSTQRPSVNIITGLIKANIPARVALKVASQIDSRTILDTGGAEKLLGSGDMLYISGETSKPVRLQSAFISENEVKKVTKYLVKEFGDAIPEDITLIEADGEKNSLFEAMNGDDEIEDDLYEDARDLVISTQKASASYLQRKLRVGYARAARLLDTLEDHSVISPGEGSKPRKVLIRNEEEDMEEEDADEEIDEEDNEE